MSSEVTPTPTRGCILVVDDQQANIQTVGTLLHSEGYDVMSATSADQALQRMRARRPDLLLLDLMMPGTSGLDLCRVLAAKPSFAEVPVIFLSAADEVGLITAALEAGAVDYVTKPFRRAELLGRIRTHIALKSARDELQRVAEEKDELLKLMAHDLKNGLAAIRLHAEFMAHNAPELDVEMRQCANTLIHEAARLADCIGELLASQAAGPQPLRLQVTDLGALAGEVVDTHRPLAEAKRQRLELEIHGSAACVILADAGAVRQVLDNLVSNAIKFSPSDRAVQVEVMPGSPNDIGPCFRIRDEGPGFTTEDQKFIFRPYGKLSARPTGDETSTGLGLSIVKKLLERMGGTIQLMSEPGQGSTFTVHLPDGSLPSRSLESSASPASDLP